MSFDRLLLWASSFRMAPDSDQWYARIRLARVWSNPRACACLDARGRSPNVLSSSQPIVRPRSRGPLPRLLYGAITTCRTSRSSPASEERAGTGAHLMGDESIAIAESYDGIADMLLLNSHRPGDVQIGALGVTHGWEIDMKIVDSVSIPVIIAGGLGPDNVVEAIRMVRPAGVDSKTKTDKDDGSHTKDLRMVKQFVARAKSAVG